MGAGEVGEEMDWRWVGSAMMEMARLKDGLRDLGFDSEEAMRASMECRTAGPLADLRALVSSGGGRRCECEKEGSMADERPAQKSRAKPVEPGSWDIESKREGRRRRGEKASTKQERSNRGMRRMKRKGRARGTCQRGTRGSMTGLWREIGQRKQTLQEGGDVLEQTKPG